MTMIKCAKALNEGGGLLALFYGIYCLIVWGVRGAPQDAFHFFMPMAVGGAMSGLGILLRRFVRSA